MAGFRIVLACLTDIDTAADTMDAALTVTRAHAALLEVLHVRADPTSALPLIGDGMPGTMVEEMLKLADRQGTDLSSALRRRFDEACARHQVPAVEVPPEVGVAAARWREETGREEDMVTAAGRLADIVVLPRLRAGKDAPSPITVNAALLDTGRPLLLAPPSPPPMIGHNVAILWNGTPQAARAVSFAMPFLAGAARIKVLAARDDAEEALPEQLAHYLERHEIAAEYKSFTAGGEIGRALIAEAAMAQADLLVMGGYTHNRLRQFIMGSVTKYILAEAPIPVLVCR